MVREGQLIRETGVKTDDTLFLHLGNKPVYVDEVSGCFVLAGFVVDSDLYIRDQDGSRRHCKYSPESLRRGIVLALCFDWRLETETKYFRLFDNNLGLNSNVDEAHAYARKVRKLHKNISVFEVILPDQPQHLILILNGEMHPDVIKALHGAHDKLRGLQESDIDQCQWDQDKSITFFRLPYWTVSLKEQKAFHRKISRSKEGVLSASFSIDNAMEPWLVPFSGNLTSKVDAGYARLSLMFTEAGASGNANESVLRETENLTAEDRNVLEELFFRSVVHSVSPNQFYIDRREKDFVFRWEPRESDERKSFLTHKCCGKAHNPEDHWLVWKNRNGYVYVRCSLRRGKGVVIGHVELTEYLGFERRIFGSFEQKDMGSKLGSFDGMSIFNNKYKVQLVRSAMGTGKTTQLFLWIKEQMRERKIAEERGAIVRPLRMLMISPRIAFAVNLTEKYNKECFEVLQKENMLSNAEQKHCAYKMACYVDADKTRLRDYHKLSVQVESLRYLENDSTAEEMKSLDYDLLILDEIESILSQFSSKTVKHLTKCVAVFEQLIRSSVKIIGLDAFLSFRSLQMFNNILGNLKEVSLLDNTWKPKLRAVEYTKVPDLQNSAVAYLRSQKESLDEGLDVKKICIVSGSKNKALQIMHELKLQGIVAVFYCSDQQFLRVTRDDIPDKIWNYIQKHYKKHLKYGQYGKEEEVDMKDCDYMEIPSFATVRDIEMWWSLPQLLCVGYTSSITVGLDFNREGFYAIYAMFSSTGSSVRDTMQGTMRVREFVSKELHYAVQSAARKSEVSKEKFFESERLLKEKTEEDWKQLKIELPKVRDWMTRLHLENKFERYLSENMTTEMTSFYLTRCGYTIEHSPLENTNFNTLKEIEFEDIEVLKLDEYKRLRNSHERITHREHMQCCRYEIEYLWTANASIDQLKHLFCVLWDGVGQHTRRRQFNNLLYEHGLGIHDDVDDKELESRLRDAFERKKNANITDDSIISKLKNCRNLCKVLGAKHSLDTERELVKLQALGAKKNWKYFKDFSFITLPNGEVERKKLNDDFGIELDPKQPFHMDEEIFKKKKFTSAVMGKLFKECIDFFFRYWCGSALNSFKANGSSTQKLANKFFREDIAGILRSDKHWQNGDSVLLK